MADSVLRDSDDDQVGLLYAKAMAVMARLREDAINRETGQKEGPIYPISRAAELAGCTAADIRAAEAAGRLPGAIPRSRRR